MLLLLACAGPSPDTGNPADTADTADSGDTDTPAVEGCRATPGAADRARTALVSLPYDASGGQADTWMVLDLSTDGTLTEREQITMGRATGGEVVYTPDGSLALAVTADGGVAVYDTRAGAVVHESATSGYYAGRIVVDPTGEIAWIIDGNWANNGGGVYRVPIDCTTGELGAGERVLESKLPADLLWLDTGAIVVGREIGGAAATDDLARLTWDPPAWVDGVDVFGDNDAVVTDAAIVGDWILVADNSEFSGVPTRVGRVHLGDTLTVSDAVDVEDPMSIVPFDDGTARALVASGYGDAYFVLDADAGEAARVSASGVQLPSAMSALRRGGLAGRVWASEVGGVRQLQLGDTVEDLGVYSLGGGMTGLPGAVGVEP
jgi:hypothetical protein